MPEVKFSDKAVKEYHYMVMEKYGNTVEKTYKIEGEAEVVLRLGIQLIGIIEVMQGAGVIHNDIMSSNIVVGQHMRSNDMVQRGRLIDFGCATSFRNDDGTHVSEKKRNQ